MRISRISPAAFALFFIVQFLFARPVLCDIAGVEVELAPALPAHARVEPGEDIFYYSTLPDGAEWAVFPGVLGATDGVKIRGLAEGEGWLCGRNGGRVAIIRLTVKKLTPTDHEILVGLRRELSGSNTYKNQLEKADARLRDARTKMNMFPARFTDYEIRAKPAREKCDVSLNILLDNLPRLRRALSALEDSLESHAETAASLKPPTSKSGRGTPKILLPPGYSIGRYVVYPEALPIYGAGDWTRIVGFELDKRMKLEPG